MAFQTRVALGLALSLSGGVAMAENRIDQMRPDAPELAAFGEHVIGVRTLTFTNPDQPDIANAVAGEETGTVDREITVEVWYPAAEGTEPGGTYTAFLRDGQTEVTLHGQAARDAEVAEGSFPLVLISHGYPGNRFLLSHLGENLATKGYVTVSIDHPDSIYSDLGAFGSTLVNRPRDQAFVLEAMAELEGALGEAVDAENTAVIGYSMGGYGALVFGGGGVTQAGTELPYGAPNGLLEVNMAGTEAHEALPDDRVKALIAIGPWGRNVGLWDADGLAGVDKPLMLVAGSVDTVSQYDAMRTIFEETTGTDRALLTFENAGHNAAAPMPAPAESYEPVETLDFVPFEHYADPVWDNVRMNNILAHFATAFLDQHLKGAETDSYLDLVEVSGEGVWSMDDSGQPTEAHTYWQGFANGTAQGLRMERRAAGE